MELNILVHYYNFEKLYCSFSLALFVFAMGRIDILAILKSLLKVNS